jgi:hypothetical protein
LLDVTASVRPSVCRARGRMRGVHTGQDEGAGWVRKVLGWIAGIVRHPPKPAPEEVMRAWVREFDKGGNPH